MWSNVFTEINLALVSKGIWIKPMWHSGAGFIFHCGFIFFFHWIVSSRDMFQWPNLEHTQEQFLCLLCREELAPFRRSSGMNTTGLLSDFIAGCSSWAVMGPALCSKQVDVSDHPQLHNNTWISKVLILTWKEGLAFFPHYSATLLCLPESSLNTFPLLIQLPK